MSKLIKTGQWYWRDDELSVKTFRSLSKEEKEEYLDLLKGLKPEERSTQDIYILNFYSDYKPEVKNFITLKDDSNSDISI